MSTTDAQQKALRDLLTNGGQGAIDKRGVLVAGGERLAFLPETWLRLVTTGHVEAAGPNRLRITAAGRAEVAAVRHAKARVRPEQIRDGADRAVTHPGAE